MDIKELCMISKKNAEIYRNKAIVALEYYMDQWDMRYPLWGSLARVFNELKADYYYDAIDMLHDIIADGYYADDVLCEYDKIKDIYILILKYVTYKELYHASKNGIENLKHYEKMEY